MVLTGPSDKSLAAEAAYTFAAAPQPPAHIILLGRSIPKIKPVIARLKQINNSIDVKFIGVDLTDNSTVRLAAQHVQATVSKIDVLVNSAGIMAVEDYTISKEGFELQLAATHIGHFLLTGLLLPQLEASGDARVVTLTSIGYQASDFRFDDWNFSEGKEYNPWVAYGQAKTANILFTTELARRAKEQGKHITALVVHPGVVLDTGITQNTTLEKLMGVIEGAKEAARQAGEESESEKQKTIEQGCSTMVWASVAPELEGHSGAFLKDCNIFPESEQKQWIKEPEKAKKLWELSEQWVDEKFL